MHPQKNKYLESWREYKAMSDDTSVNIANKMNVPVSKIISAKMDSNESTMDVVTITLSLITSPLNSVPFNSFCIEIILINGRINKNDDTIYKIN